MILTRRKSIRAIFTAFIQVTTGKQFLIQNQPMAIQANLEQWSKFVITYKGETVEITMEELFASLKS